MHRKMKELISARRAPNLFTRSVNGERQEIRWYQDVSLVMVVLAFLIFLPVTQFVSPIAAYAQITHQTMPLYSCGDLYKNHCYGEWIWAGYMKGAKTDIKMQPITCGGACGSGGFLNYEMWVADSSNAYWVEAGVKNEAGYGYTFSFWADSRPGGGYNNHYMNGITEFGKDITFYIFSVGNNEFQVSKVRAGVNGCTSQCSADWTNYSTYNSMVPYYIKIGSELAGSSGASSPTVDFTYNYWYDGSYFHAQGSGGPGSTYDRYNPPYANWANNQIGGSTGGDLKVWCC